MINIDRGKIKDFCNTTWVAQANSVESDIMGRWRLQAVRQMPGLIALGSRSDPQPVAAPEPRTWVHLERQLGLGRVRDLDQDNVHPPVLAQLPRLPKLV